MAQDVVKRRWKQLEERARERWRRFSLDGRAPVAGRRREVDPVELDTQVVEDVELPDEAGGFLRPRSEDHLGVAVVVEVGHDGLARETEVVAGRTAGRDRVGPASMLGLVEPVRVKLAVVGR